MARVKGGYTTRRRRKKILKLAKGYFGAKHRLYKTAHEQVMHSLAYSYRDRRQVKRDMRKLWIARINAAARLNDISYSKLMHGLKLANVEINRKMLSEIAICDPKGFTEIVNTAKKALEKYRPQTIYLIIGLMIGSIYAIIMGATTLKVPRNLFKTKVEITSFS